MKRLGSILILLMLTGCGFRLAGSDQGLATLGAIRLSADQGYAVIDSPMLQRLRSRLSAAGVEIREDADLHLALGRINERRRTLSVDADGKVIEHELITTVQWRVTRGKRTLVPRQLLSTRRELSFDPTSVLSKRTEEAQHREEMQQELAERLLVILPARVAAADAAAEQGASPAY